MASPNFSKFIRPETPRRGQISERDLDILDVALRYRFSPASQIVRLVGGNEDVTHRRLRYLWECGLLNRWAFPGIRTHSEFYYYVDNASVIDLLAQHRGLIAEEQMIDEINNHRDKNYGQAAYNGQHMRLGFLQHSLMISRLHFCLEMACRQSEGAVELSAFAQGAQLSGHKVEVSAVRSAREGNQYSWEESERKERLPVEPDAMFTLRFPKRSPEVQLAHFCYEADRGTMGMTAMLIKLRAYFHFIKRQQGHRQAFGVHPIRAVLFEVPDEMRARRLMELVQHPLVSGPDKRAGLFWFTITPMLTARTDNCNGPPARYYLLHPSIIFDSIWALPDRSMLALTDTENRPLAHKVSTRTA